MTTLLDRLTKDDFSRCLNETFTVSIEGGEPLETELIEVRGLVAPDDDPDRRQPFSLIFRGPKEAPLKQGVFHLENETLGKLDLFLVTVGPDKEGMRHEAVFA